MSPGGDYFQVHTCAFNLKNFKHARKRICMSLISIEVLYVRMHNKKKTDLSYKSINRAR